MLFTMLNIIFIIPREICNMDILLHVCIIFKISNKRCFFQNRKKLKFLTHPYINISTFLFISNMRFFKYYWSQTYIKFHNLYMHKTSYAFILIFKDFFFYSAINLFFQCIQSQFLNKYKKFQVILSGNWKWKSTLKIGILSFFRWDKLLIFVTSNQQFIYLMIRRSIFNVLLGIFLVKKMRILWGLALYFLITCIGTE